MSRFPRVEPVSPLVEQLLQVRLQESLTHAERVTLQRHGTGAAIRRVMQLGVEDGQSHVMVHFATEDGDFRKSLRARIPSDWVRPARDHGMPEAG